MDKESKRGIFIFCSFLLLWAGAGLFLGLSQGDWGMLGALGAVATGVGLAIFLIWLSGRVIK